MQRDSTDAEDLQKIGEFLAGDRRAFEFLFEKYRERIFAVAFRFVRNKEDALDVTQEVFLRAYQGLAKFKTDAKFFTWLYRIAVNRAIDFTRARATRRTVDAEDPHGEGEGLLASLPSPDAQDPADLAQRRELSGKLLEAVESLPPKHRVVFILHSMEDLSYKEIAGVVGCSMGTVMSRLFYARKKLQQYLAGTAIPH
jgi:RNA polymerase sigma-70 factor (ECF subfamily)